MLTSALAFILFIVAVCYIYLTRNHNYWESRGVACRKPTLFFGNLKQRILNTNGYVLIREFYDEMKGKPFAGLYEGVRPVLVVLDPELIKQVLIQKFNHFTDRPYHRFNDGGLAERTMAVLKCKEWKSAKSVCSPAFSPSRVKTQVPVFNELARKMVQHLVARTNHTAGSSVELDLRTVLISYSLDAVAAAGFGLNSNSFYQENSELIAKALQFQELSFLKRVLTFICVMCQIPDWITRHIPLSVVNNKTIWFIKKLLIDTKSHRLQHNIRRNDLLQLLIDATSDEPCPDNEQAGTAKAKLTEDIALSQSLFVFIAGFETTSSNLLLACYELAKNQDKQEKARRIVQDCWPLDGDLTHDALMNMYYLDMIILEVSRLYPPIPSLERLVTKPVTFNGLHLELDTKLIIPTYGIHMDPEYYPDPMAFMPERFDPQECASRNSALYLAFGAGPRKCLATRFSQLVSTVALAFLLNNFRFDICDKTPIPFVADRLAFFIKSKDNIILKLTIL